MKTEGDVVQWPGQIIGQFMDDVPRAPVLGAHSRWFGCPSTRSVDGPLYAALKRRSNAICLVARETSIPIFPFPSSYTSDPSSRDFLPLPTLLYLRVPLVCSLRPQTLLFPCIEPNRKACQSPIVPFLLASHATQHHSEEYPSVSDTSLIRGHAQRREEEEQ